MSETPYEVIAGPLEVWVGPTGESFPDVNDTPTGNWTKVGTSGVRTISEDGVTITHPQTVEVARSAGSTGPIKAWRTEEELHIAFSLLDLSPEEYARALNGNSVETVAAGVGTSGVKQLGLSRGRTVAQVALLLRGTDMSSEGSDLNCQYEFPRAVEQGEPELAYVKGAPVMIGLEYQIIEDPDATSEDERFGRYVVQTEEPGT